MTMSRMFEPLESCEKLERLESWVLENEPPSAAKAANGGQGFIILRVCNACKTPIRDVWPPSPAKNGFEWRNKQILIQ
jgi:hypothetical protein